MTFISDCACDSEGANSFQCNEIGQCQCKTNIQGIKCDECVEYSIGFPNCTGIILLPSLILINLCFFYFESMLIYSLCI